MGVPGIILRCLDHMDLNDLGRPVAFMAKMVCHRPLAIQLVSKGLLDPNSMRKLFDCLAPKEVKLDALMIISDLARMDKVCFHHQMILCECKYQSWSVYFIISVQFTKGVVDTHKRN